MANRNNNYRNRSYLHIFQLPEERQRRVYEDIKEESRGDLDFYLLSIFSGIIITLGLLINNAAVIIGGMLIAPLVWPVLALAMAIIKGSVRLLTNSLFTLGKVTVVILIFSYLIGLVSPFDIAGEEFLSRVQPTLIELMIALAAGFVGAFIVAHPKIHSSIAGVVVAVALVPPICVLGLTFVEQDLFHAMGAALLYFTNLIAVTFAAALYFILSHFRAPYREEEKRRRTANLIWTVVFLALALVPLVWITNNLVDQEEDEKLVRKIIEINLPDVKVDDLIIREIENKTYLDIVVKSPENLTPEQTDALTTEISKQLDRSVDLEIMVIPTLEAGEVVEEVELEAPNENILDNSNEENSNMDENVNGEVESTNEEAEKAEN